MKRYQLILPWLAALGAVSAQSQISKKPDASPSAQQPNVGHQYSTFLTSMIRQPDLIPHDIDAVNDQGQLDTAESNDNDSEYTADVQADMFDADADYDSDDTDSELVATGSSDEGHPKKHDPGDVDDRKEDKKDKKEEKKERKAAKKNVTRVKWYKQPNCKRHSHRSNRRMVLDTCERLHRPAAYKFESKEKHSKKHKDDDDDDDVTEYGSNCTMTFYSDGSCKNQVWVHSGSTDASEASCVNIGRTEDSDNDRHKGIGRPDHQVWAAMLTCGENDSSESSDSDYGSSSRIVGVSKTT